VTIILQHCISIFLFFLIEKNSQRIANILSFHLVLVTLHRRFALISIEQDNEPLGAKGPPLVGEEVRNKDVGKVES